MEAVNLIIEALGAGAVEALTGKTAESAYRHLKELISGRFKGKQSAEIALSEYEKEPQVWEAPLKSALLREGIQNDPEIIEQAHKVIQTLQSQKTTGKYNIQIAGNVTGFAQGDHQTTTMNFGGGPER